MSTEESSSPKTKVVYDSSRLPDTSTEAGQREASVMLARMMGLSPQLFSDACNFRKGDESGEVCWDRGRGCRENGDVTYIRADRVTELVRDLQQYVTNHEVDMSNLWAWRELEKMVGTSNRQVRFVYSNAAASENDDVAIMCFGCASETTEDEYWECPTCHRYLCLQCHESRACNGECDGCMLGEPPPLSEPENVIL